jgi:hypothetical protein
MGDDIEKRKYKKRMKFCMTFEDAIRLVVRAKPQRKKSKRKFKRPNKEFLASLPELKLQNVKDLDHRQ